jgi:hypothetical protein
MGHVAILQGSIGYAYGLVLMIPLEGERVVFCFFQTLRPGSRMRIKPRMAPALDVGPKK